MKLTDVTIRNLKATDKQIIYVDDNLSNFGVRVSKRHKTFVVKVGKNRSVKSIGRYPDITLAEARKKAKRLLANYSYFDSPISYTEAVEEFLDYCRTKNRPETIRQYKYYLNDCSFKRNVSDITRKEVLKHAATYPESGAAHRHTLASLRVFFRWCLRKEYIEKNPIDGELITAAPVRTRILTPHELKKVYHYEDQPFSDIVKLLILTGQRRTETTNIHADWIDGDTVTFPSEITKNKREHTIPVGDLTLQLLQGNGRMFKNQIGTVFQGFGKAKTRMDKVVKIPHWTLHDLRRTYSSTHAMLGTPLHITEMLLNHASGTISGVAAVYNRYQYLDEKREAVKRYEEYLSDILKLPEALV